MPTLYVITEFEDAVIVYVSYGCELVPTTIWKYQQQKQSLLTVVK